MNKIIVIGCPGAGKSTLSRELSQLTGLPLYYMDSIFWNEDKTHLEREELIEELEKIVVNDEWIIDGNYSGTLDLRLQYADGVFFLDYPLDVCLAGIEARVGSKREDMPWVEETLDEEFVAYVKDFHATQVDELRAMLKKRDDVITFTSRDECRAYIEKLREELK